MKAIGKMFCIVCFLIGISPLLAARSIASEPKDSHSRVHLVGDDLSAWQGDTGDWQVAGEVFIKPDNEKKLAAKPGTGVIWNGQKGKAKHLTTKAEFGDIKVHIEFVIPKDSNSGIYFAGQYELQIYDNCQKRSSFYPGIECGGIYQRWDTERKPKGFEGHSPRVDASFPSGRWQTFDVIFRAARFDRNGRKTANAKFVKVFHNGILIHENVELNGPTRGSMFAEEKPRGPLLFQGNHGPVAYRNIWVAPIDEPDFFVFGYALRDAGIATEEQGGLLRELEYDGMGHVGYEGLAGVVQELDRNGLRMFSMYVRAQLDEGKPKYSPKLKEAIQILAGRDAILIITINSRKYKLSETAGDDKAVEIVREISDMAVASGVRVALYSHYDFWMGRFGDSVRIAKKVDRKNVGTVFSLCHWLREGDNDMRPFLEESIDHLFAVVIHGADHKGGRKELIQLLGNGNYDVYPLLQKLKELGYSGPFGLLHYRVAGDIRESLARAMKVWRDITKRIRTKRHLVGDDLSAWQGNDFFVFGSAIRRKELTVKQGVQLIRESGYDGMEYERYEGITEIVEELDKNGLRLYALYLGVQLDRNKPKYDPRLKETIELLKGRDVTLWINIQSRKLKRSDPAGDARAVEILREIDDLTAGKGFRIALYPHHKFWLERVEDSVRVAKKVNRKNVGTVFNLCHWLKVEGKKDVKPVLQAALPYLFSVSINGAEYAGGWEKLIQPLDSGEYDVCAFLETLKKTGYSGPIGLQTYGITAPARDHLARSMKTWRQFIKRLTPKTK